MSALSQNLTARRESLGLTVPQVHAALTLRGINVAESTVYGWFNGSRGVRNMEHLRALVGVLQTEVDRMLGDEAEVVEGTTQVMIARELHGLSDLQMEAVLATIKAMKGGGR